MTAQRETGDRMIGGAETLSGLRSRPSGLRFGFPGAGTGSGILSSVIDAAIDSALVPFRVAGGRMMPAQRETGDRMIGGAETLSGPRSQPSGIWFGYSGAGTGSGPLPSVIDSAIYSALHSVLCSVSSYPLTANR